MTRSNFDDVGDFQEKFGLDNVTHHGAGPRETRDDLMLFRVRFLHEELQEFEDAWKNADEVGMFDALIDLVYIALGTAHLRGYPWQAGWDAVQRTNMLKIRAAGDGSDSKRGSAWDVVKPPGWQPPDLAAVLARAHEDTVVPPVQCPMCFRELEKTELREHIVERFGHQYVAVHCVCGFQLDERPA